MTDRYANGDPSNDTGGAPGALERDGLRPDVDRVLPRRRPRRAHRRLHADDPSDTGSARIKGLGFTAVWITPPFVQRTVAGRQRGLPRLLGPRLHDGRSAPRHRGRLRGFVTCAHSARPEGVPRRRRQPHRRRHHLPAGQRVRARRQVPYRDCHGPGLQPGALHVGHDRSRGCRPERSFAKMPVVAPAATRRRRARPSSTTSRSYHNRGDIAWGSCVGRCEMDGDFYGLDDLLTEDWTVVQALATRTATGSRSTASTGSASTPPSTSTRTSSAAGCR